jgi:hypothetical protein
MGLAGDVTGAQSPGAPPLAGSRDSLDPRAEDEGAPQSCDAKGTYTLNYSMDSLMTLI